MVVSVPEWRGRQPTERECVSWHVLVKRSNNSDSSKASFDRESRTVEELTRTIRAQLQTTAWEGPAAERFRSMWSGEYEVSLRKLQEALVDAGAEVARRQTALLQAGS